MRFSVDFNREHRDKDLPLIGAKLEYHEEWQDYYVDINNIEDLEKLHNKVKELLGFEYDLIVGFDPPTIYIDKDL